MEDQKTYTEAQGKDLFNWNEVVNHALTHGDGELDLPELEKRSGNWVTCAVGNLCDALPRDHNGAPEDEYLFNWGNSFAHAISNRQWMLAKVLLSSIEERSTALLNDMTANKE